MDDRDWQDAEDVGRATGAGEVHEDFLSNLSRISQLTGTSLLLLILHNWLTVIRIFGPYLRGGICQGPWV